MQCGRALRWLCVSRQAVRIRLIHLSPPAETGANSTILNRADQLRGILASRWMAHQPEPCRCQHLIFRRLVRHLHRVAFSFPLPFLAGQDKTAQAIATQSKFTSRFIWGGYQRSWKGRLRQWRRAQTPTIRSGRRHHTLRDSRKARTRRRRKPTLRAQRQIGLPSDPKSELPK